MGFELFDFGAATQKPICLYSTEEVSLTAPPVVSERVGSAPTAYTLLAPTVTFDGSCLCFRNAFDRWSCLCFRYLDQHGQRRCVGGEGLKQTENYPPAFGSAYFSWWVQASQRLRSSGSNQRVYIRPI